MRVRTWLLAPAATVFACSSNDSPEPTSTVPPRDFGRPTPCSLVPSAEPLCDFDPLAGMPGSSMGGAAGGGAAGPGGAGGASPLDEDDPTTACLISEDVLLRCPSRVGMLDLARGSEDEIDLAIAQLGTDALNEHATLIPNDQAYVQTLRLSPGGEQLMGTDVPDPFPAAEGALALLPASSSGDTLLVHHTQSGESPPGTLSLLPLLGGDPVGSFEATAPLLQRPRAFVTSQGEGVFFGHAFTAGLFVTAGLPHSPRQVAVTEAGSAAAVDATSMGQLRAAVQDTARLRLLGGGGLDQELWATDVEPGVNLPRVDLLHVPGEQGDRAVLLSRNGDTDRPNVRFVDGDGTATLPAYFGLDYSTCSFSIGITCDDCPVGDTCQAGHDILWDTRLFQAEGRTFVAYLATDSTELREFERHVTPLIDLGCTCDTKSLGTQETADFLVVLEIEPPSSPEERPTVTERMRRPIAEPRTAQHTILARGPNGTLDVLFGPHLARFRDGQRSFPEDPVEYRMIRVDPLGAHR